MVSREASWTSHPPKFTPVDLVVSQLKGGWGCCLEGFGRVVVAAVVHIARRVVILKRARMVEKVCMRDGGILGNMCWNGVCTELYSVERPTLRIVLELGVWLCGSSLCYSTPYI